MPDSRLVFLGIGPGIGGIEHVSRDRLPVGLIDLHKTHTDIDAGFRFLLSREHALQIDITSG